MSRATAPGKVILAGEHFVVHGGAALAAPLPGRGVTIEAEPVAAPWLCPPAVEAHLRACLEALGEEPDTWRVRVETDLPMGAGLGGSAALAAALVQAMRPEETSLDALRREAHILEKIAHGSPSGIDDAVSVCQRPVHMLAGGTLRILEGAIHPGLWVGVTAERTSTREAVAQVARFRDGDPRAFDDLVHSSDRLVESVLSAGQSGRWAEQGEDLLSAHQLLCRIGVSTAGLDQLVESALSAGAWGAKLTGGGLGGAVVATAPPGVDLQEVWMSAGATEVIAP